MVKESQRGAQNVMKMAATANKPKKANILKLYKFINEKQTR